MTGDPVLTNHLCFVILVGRNCKPKHILGVDIDKSLIQKAIAQLRTVYSLQQPEVADSTTPNPEMTFDVRLHTHYFPKSMAVMYAHVPMTVPPGHESATFPSNVSFEAGDWMDMDTKTDHYDTILA
jgi:7SK snRNA methylphosphate capping enzyme